MAHSHNLLKAAYLTVQRVGAPKGPPLQATLRRAVSTAYYSLFHRLIEAAVDRLVGKTRDPDLWRVVARAFDHGQMKDLASALARGHVPRPLRTVITAVSDPVREIGQTFVDLQELRRMPFG